MQWRDPHFFWLLVALLPLAAALVVLLRRRAARLRLFAEEALVARLAPDLDARRRAWRMALRIATLVVLALALAGPKWGFEWREVRREGIDLIVALDTSRSMLAADVKPNRLERAKLAIQDMLRLLDGDRVGLVAFAGTAFLQCPLTVDYAAFEASLRATNVGIIPRGGTALERAIDTSLAAFEAGEGKHEALILITDGEDHEGEPEKAAARAAESGVKVFTVGIGTTEGELVPAREGASGFLKDRKGQVVKTRLNESALEKIAIDTDGAYVRGGGTSLGLEELFRDHIAKMERREVASSLERLYEERFQIPLALALLLFIVEAWIGDRKPIADRRRWLRLPRPRLPLRRSPRSTAPARGAAEVSVLVLLLAFSPPLLGWLDRRGDRAAEGNRLYEQGKYEEAAAKYGDGLVDSPGSPLLQFNLGTALYKQGKFEEAIGPLGKVAASADPAWSAPASYNLGNALYRLAAGGEETDPQGAIGHYEQALAAYKRAMGAAPGDVDPKYNHELAARKLAELKKLLEEEKQEQQEQQEQQQQQEQQEQEQPQEQGEQEEQQQPEEQPQEPQQEQAEEQQEQQQGEEQPQEEAGGQQQDEQQPEQEQAEQQQGPGEQHPPPQEEASEQAQAGGEQPLGEATEEASPDEQAAQAVLDMAAEEELRPEDLQRKSGVAGVGEPLQDW